MNCHWRFIGLSTGLNLLTNDLNQYMSQQHYVLFFMKKNPEVFFLFA